MQKIVILALAFAASLAAADYSGIWNGKGGIESAKYGSVPWTSQLTLLQAGSSVSGTLKMGNGKPTALTTGSVSGSQITFAIGTGSTASLTQNGTQLQGKITSSTGDIYDVVFTKQ
jgi:hypothetical protein